MVETPWSSCDRDANADCDPEAPFPAFTPAHIRGVAHQHCAPAPCSEEHMALTGFIMADGSWVEVTQMPTDFSEWLPQMHFIIIQGGNNFEKDSIKRYAFLPYLYFLEKFI